MKYCYTISQSSLQSILSHFKNCDEQFLNRLEKKQKIDRYSKKLFQAAIRFEAWNDDDLIGLIAIYFNHPEKELGYITNVSINKDHLRKGIASTLLSSCFKYAKKLGTKELVLEVDSENHRAIALYQKFHFNIFQVNPDNFLMKCKIQ